MELNWQGKRVCILAYAHDKHMKHVFSRKKNILKLNMLTNSKRADKLTEPPKDL